ncbi:MAG TPA: tRNA adenosine(34) deaminase TadA [Candidatus Limiplasma sp.]|nr:tRNA adenosine(34) deaminase TadA [Candidatus Limiplasma sp.]HPS80600.1 tRNA adenosine(34) deaminase TadA [Candidatus Limiplasma sp.]
MNPHEQWMRLALEQAAQAETEGEIPVGAVLVCNGEAIACAHNRREALTDPTAHAEILALRAGAQALGSRRLSDCALYVTLEPCPMCAGAMVMASLGRCYFGAADARQGCCESVYALPNDPAFYWQVPCVGGLLAAESETLLRDFFSKRREP